MRDYPIVNFEEKMKEEQTSNMIKGIRTFYGGGNVFHVTKLEPDPIVIHVRPLAIRVLRLKFK